jgi:hypothetical protein
LACQGLAFFWRTATAAIVIPALQGLFFPVLVANAFVLVEDYTPNAAEYRGKLELMLRSPVSYPTNVTQAR